MYKETMPKPMKNYMQIETALSLKYSKMSNNKKKEKKAIQCATNWSIKLNL